ncbi:hypothetical protein AOLI_G00311410 [Acnodon oligacanthus]
MYLPGGIGLSPRWRLKVMVGVILGTGGIGVRGMPWIRPPLSLLVHPTPRKSNRLPSSSEQSSIGCLQCQSLQSLSQENGQA